MKEIFEAIRQSSSNSKLSDEKLAELLESLLKIERDESHKTRPHKILINLEAEIKKALEE